MIPRNVLLTIALLLVALLLMGLYGFHLRKQALELQQPAKDTKPIAPPVSGATEKLTIFAPIDGRGTLTRREINATLPSEPTLRAREIVRLLISAWQEKDSKHPIGNDADVKDVYLLDNNRTAVVDVNAAFADQHRSGILVEELTVAALARSLGANLPGVTTMKIIVEGHERDTLAGHADLGEFYSTNLDWRVE
jgi:hypothetical protein